MEMEYEQSRREFFRHSLFGGSSTDVVEHEVYTIHLSDINNSYRCEFEALGQPLICGSIPPVCPRSFLEGSEELDVSDLMRDRIEVLIGADVAGRLLTDAQRRISSGLVAIRTKLGWTVMGKIPPTEVRDDTSSLCVTTLLSLDLENLWKLDAIGVSDAEVEKKTQSLQAEMEEHFAHTTTRDIEGRYEVALPWVQDKERIPSNRDLAETQLSSVRRKLEEVGDMNEYGQIFEEWMKQGIIEYAREDKQDGVHYLPHRPVYKRNSHTSRIRPVFNASARKRDHFLVSLLIRWNHETHGHAGLQTLLGILRENYWILRSRKTVKKIINQCIRCKRFTVTPATVESTSLPEDRVRDAAVFEIVGVDLTGHLILKNKKKAWIVIFTCAVYRGVHLELVTSLSMEAFLQAFRRFIARRGRPLIVYSDNGTNFKGMANALKKIDFSILKCDPTLKNITWKFIPPGAPWWGGWWERLIGMMKQLLFRILGQTSLGYEELSTVMCDVESLMNTRPLTYLTEESEDLAPLTPSLFLHEVREVGVPDLDLIDNQTLSRKYQYIKRVREDLRERFRIEYFGFLRQETRRLKTTIPLKLRTAHQETQPIGSTELFLSMFESSRRQLKVKLQILREIEVEKKKKTDVAQKHNIPQSSLSTIIKNSEKIHQQALHAGESSRKRARGSTYADVDEALLQWFKQARSAALPVNGPLLSEKAKTLALEFGLKDFTGSGGWIERWKARHGIKLRNICGESADVNRETMTNWLTDVMPNIISNYACKDIFNADETGLFWRLFLTRHFTLREKLAPAERLMQPLVIGKAKQPRCFRGIKHLPVQYEANQKAWMTGLLFESWVRHIDKKMAGQHRQIILLLDNCGAHPPDMQGLTNTRIAFLPPNTTSMLQPCDQGIIRNFKMIYRTRLMRKYLTAYDAGTALTINLKQAVDIISVAWNDVLPATISNCWHHSGIIKSDVSSPLDTPQPATQMWEQQSLFDRMKEVLKIPLEMDFDSYADADNDIVTNAMLSDVEIVESILQAKEEETDQVDEEVDPIVHIPHPKEVLESIQTLQLFLQCQDESKSLHRHLSDLDNIEKSVQHLLLTSKCQKKITNYFSKNT
ncbi:hypothetical protein LAZ67_6001729 [Cordylochernes scorpioides]|uniref:Tigger transposable element-derived protein 6 n=1 Tax=Cordylochernes scorpioides TaxID=51811 RepID=A0ABY6KP81_9ARAC|nr:hypothetical protein LAZ67_6001729 [Cordylochernes scorpioides]